MVLRQEQLSNFNKDEYDMALIYNISDMRFDFAVQAGLDEEQLVEAFFFCEEKSAHVYRKNGVWKVAVFDESENKDLSAVECSYKLIGKYSKWGEKVSVREYLDYDEDGQAHIVFRRLVKVC